MGSLSDDIAVYDAAKREKVPAEVLATMAAATGTLKALGIEQQAVGAGDPMPDFELSNQHGDPRRLSAYLAKSPVVLNIYRGGWCPYCNMEMKALSNALDAIRAHGADLIGMAPETPDHALATADRHDIGIDILSDPGNKVAESLGLIFELPEALRPIYQKLGIDIPAYNGDDSFRLPVPATYIIGRDGLVSYAFVNADYTRRMEPDHILEQLASA